MIASILKSGMSGDEDKTVTFADMNITEQELFEILGRKDAQIYGLNKQIAELRTQIQILNKSIEEAKPKKKASNVKLAT